MQFRNVTGNVVIVTTANEKLNNQPKENIWVQPGQVVDIEPEYGRRLKFKSLLEEADEKAAIDAIAKASAVKAETSTVGNTVVETKQETKSSRKKK